MEESREPIPEQPSGKHSGPERRTFSLTRAETDLIRRVREEEGLRSDSAAVRRLLSNAAAIRLLAENEFLPPRNNVQRL